MIDKDWTYYTRLGYRVNDYIDRKNGSKKMQVVVTPKGKDILSTVSLVQSDAIDKFLKNRRRLV